ncbi:hypothetical protein [Mangrovactinospora gilvigrisea]|uniref:hypothetical protein n=1 Tax=Mangrovactinospora gilvigrisea TaxID=1428644 RepID=UPI000AD0120C|nr:hypothetical protein [Mangrovactinospora gilvigrisea]
MGSTVGAAALLALSQSQQDNVHTGPGFLRWVVIGLVVGVVLVGWVVLRGYGKR